MVNVWNKSIDPFLRFSKTRLIKIENCSKFIMAVMLRKILVHEIKRAQTNKTFMALKMAIYVLCQRFV